MVLDGATAHGDRRVNSRNTHTFGHGQYLSYSSVARGREWVSAWARGIYSPWGKRERPPWTGSLSVSSNGALSASKPWTHGLLGPTVALKQRPRRSLTTDIYLSLKSLYVCSIQRARKWMVGLLA